MKSPFGINPENSMRIPQALKHPARILFCLLLAGSNAHAQWGSTFEIEPIAYFGPRDEEPLQQGISLLQVRKERADEGFFANGHVQLELRGDQNVNADLDRIGYLSREKWGWVTLGRIHPWELTSIPTHADGMSRPSAAYNPWSLNGQTQAQNLGLELGFFAPEQAFRQPVLAGWLGIHIDLPENADFPVSISASASPFFIPTIGGQVRFSSTESTKTGRFGRTPPASVLVGGATLPLFYRVNTDRLFDDILLQPQFMVQAKYHSRTEGAARWSSHFWIERAPQPDPTASATGTIRVSESSVSAIAEITPAFPQRWTLGMTEVVRIDESDLEFFVSVNGAIGTESNSLPPGAELGGRWGRISASLLHRLSSTESGSQTDITSNPDSAYERALLQIQATAKPLETLTAALGTQLQLTSTDSVRISGQITYQVPASPWSLQLSGDLFGGSNGTWFGEWRTNDRLAFMARYSL